MSARNIVCWKCGGRLPSYCLPIRHYDLCPHCREDLHNCRMCRAYDPSLSGKCRKEKADYISQKERANYCHYFQARANAHKAIDNKSDKALQELTSLFKGDESNAVTMPKNFIQNRQEAKEDLHKLFGTHYEKTDEDLTTKEKVHHELNKIFGENK